MQERAPGGERVDECDMKGVQVGGVNRVSVNMSGEGVEGVGGREFTWASVSRGA